MVVTASTALPCEVSTEAPALAASGSSLTTTPSRMASDTSLEV